jgi:hypothetical protein
MSRPGRILPPVLLGIVIVALVGAVTSLLVLSRWHDRQLGRLAALP